MMRLLRWGLLAVCVMGACGREPAGGAGGGSEPAVVSNVPLGHFRLRILVRHEIDRSNAGPGTAVVLKAYPEQVAAEADFYLAAGAQTEAVAAVGEGKLLLLRFADLQLTADRAEARQYLLDANFEVKTATGPGRAWPYVCVRSAPVPSFTKGAAVGGEMSSFGRTRGRATLTSAEEYELTYLGLSSEKELMEKTGRVVDPMPAGFKEQAEAELTELGK